MTIKTLTITQPDDWHLHLRENLAMRDIVGFSAAQMGRAIVMPNLKNPIVNVTQAQSYHDDIISALPKGSNFKPLMTLYLTDNTSKEDISNINKYQHIIGAKLYPAGATSNSEHGVTNIKKIYPILATMQQVDLPLLIHGEVVNNEVDIFDREAVFIDTILAKIHHNFPNLRIVLEHITTKDAVDFVRSSPNNIAATITPQHLLNNRNSMLNNSIHPHYFCLPVLKRARPHQQALIAAATSANPKFFLGTDSAPHPKHKKESDCGCAGIFSAHIAIELYATVFEKASALDKLEGFASFFGADFYHLPRNNKTLTLYKKNQTIVNSYAFDNTILVPYMAGKTISWSARLN